MSKKKMGLLMLILTMVSMTILSGCSKNFSIEGKWKNVGSTTYGQIQAGAIVSFNGSKCNVVSPSDTYAFYENGSGDGYTLDVTTLLFSQTLSFNVTVEDNDHISLENGGTVIQLERIN